MHESSCSWRILRYWDTTTVRGNNVQRLATVCRLSQPVPDPSEICFSRSRNRLRSRTHSWFQVESTACSAVSTVVWSDNADDEGDKADGTHSGRETPSTAARSSRTFRTVSSLSGTHSSVFSCNTNRPHRGNSQTKCEASNHSNVSVLADGARFHTPVSAIYLHSRERWWWGDISVTPI